MNPTAVLELRGASVRVGGTPLWSGVNLTVGAGEFVAVLGPNGAGKSTLLKALLGLQPVSAGEIRVFGERPGTDNRRIGYRPQRRSFDSSLRVRGIDVVRLGLDGDRWGVPLPVAPRSRRRYAEPPVWDTDRGADHVRRAAGRRRSAGAPGDPQRQARWRHPITPPALPRTRRPAAHPAAGPRIRRLPTRPRLTAGRAKGR
ncbi:MAG: ATP-binding cassette domain-containing protein [Micromonosporaceae bacterium]